MVQSYGAWICEVVYVNLELPNNSPLSAVLFNVHTVSIGMWTSTGETAVKLMKPCGSVCWLPIEKDRTTYRFISLAQSVIQGHRYLTGQTGTQADRQTSQVSISTIKSCYLILTSAHHNKQILICSDMIFDKDEGNGG